MAVRNILGALRTDRLVTLSDADLTKYFAVFLATALGREASQRLSAADLDAGIILEGKHALVIRHLGIVTVSETSIDACRRSINAMSVVFPTQGINKSAGISVNLGIGTADFCKAHLRLFSRMLSAESLAVADKIIGDIDRFDDGALTWLDTRNPLQPHLSSMTRLINSM